MVAANYGAPGCTAAVSTGIINDVPLHWRWLMIFTLTVGHAVPRHAAGGAQGTLAARVPAHIVTHTGGTARGSTGL